MRHSHIIIPCTSLSDRVRQNMAAKSSKTVPAVTSALLGYWPVTIWSHGTKSDMLGRKLHSGTSKPKAGQGELVRVALFWESHYARCVPACVILYHVIGSCKGPIGVSVWNSIPLSVKLLISSKFRNKIKELHLDVLLNVKITILAYTEISQLTH